MKVKSILINNFRGYEKETKISMSDFVALVGKMILVNQQF